MNAQRTVLALTAIASALSLASLNAQAQNGVFRPPALNVGPRINTPAPAVVVAPRIDPNIAGRVGDVGGTSRLSTNGMTNCPAAYRSTNGECLNQPIGTEGTGNGSAGNGANGGSNTKGKKTSTTSRNNAVQTALAIPAVINELVAELDGNTADELARRHRLRLISLQNFPLINATIGLFRITDRRSAERVRNELATEASVRSVQFNNRFILQDEKAAQSEGDAAQYATQKLRLPLAHTLSHGANVTVAVIDSGIDIRHPELANSIIETFDALGSSEGPHFHGTGIAGAIVAHSRLIGSAPSAKLLAIRAFGASSSGAQSSTYVILRSLDFAASHGAQIVNMSFAGPRDSLIERGIATLAAKGIVMVAAAGNAGAKSPPLYPAANDNVIAVSATDAKDQLFSASNRGSYIALAAPGADIFLPAPDQKYQMASGTSFAAAYVSGIAALMLERNPALKSHQLRAMLTKTARDLGSPGRDDSFGAGEADAYAAVEAAIAAAPGPVASTEQTKEAGKAGENASDGKETPPVGPPATAIASEKAAVRNTAQ
jgi:hypothetical protein